MYIQSGPKISHSNYQEIILLSANEIRFIRQIKVSIKPKNIICWYEIFCVWPTFWRQLLPDLHISDVCSIYGHMMSALSLASACLSKSWILFLDHLLDGVFCKISFDLYIFSFYSGFQSWFYSMPWFYPYRNSKWWRHILGHRIFNKILCSFYSQNWWKMLPYCLFLIRFKDDFW